MKGTAILDVDGVLVDCAGHALKLVGAPQTVEDITDYDMFSFLSTEHRDAVYAMWEGFDFWRDLPVIEGAQEGVIRLRRYGFRVVFATSPWVGCHGWENARRASLGQLFDAKSSDVVSIHDKALLNGDLFIDDKAEHVRAWHQAAEYRMPWMPQVTGKSDRRPHRAVMFDQPWNRKDANWPARMKGWTDLERCLENGGLL